MWGRGDGLKMQTAFKNKTILITGATGTVGSGLARHFAARGAELILTARNLARLQALADDIGAGKVRVRCVAADLSHAASLETLTKTILESCPHVDILINNAADVTSKPLMETALDEIDRQIRTNVTGPLQLCRLMVPVMTDGDRVIVNISSLAGYKPNPAQTVYSVSKAGINAVSEALRAELSSRGFHVVNVALMGIGTGPGQVSVETFAARLQRSISRREHELFLYRRTKWLMRLYGMFPMLARMR